MSMKITDSCIPIGAFKAQAKKYLADLAKHETPIIITQKGRAAAVLVPPELWDWYSNTKLQHSIARGEADLAAGRVFPHAQVLGETAARFAPSKKTVKKAVAAKRTRRK